MIYLTSFRGSLNAFGAPGIEPKWTRGNKEGVGTAYSADSKIWFTIGRASLTEIYYPTVDRPQLRDMEYLISDGKSFFHEEKRHLHSYIERLEHEDLGYRIVNTDPQGNYEITKQILADPHLPCVLQHTRFEARGRDFSEDVHLYALCAPHLDGGGACNNAYVVKVASRELLVAEKNGTWLAMGATIPFKKLSCGYVGTSDGWTDLNDNMLMDWEFDQALNGNVALTGELDIFQREENREFTLGIALGSSLHNAVTTLFQSLGIPFSEHRMRFLEQWNRPYQRIRPLEKASGDGGNLYRASYSILLAGEDKTYPGAMVASLSIPWGEAKGDEDKGGYHLVWTRDLVNCASGLLAAGNTETPLRALIYLFTSQQEDGGFPQNFWIDGQTYWSGIQLDEVALPIILAWRMSKANALQNFDPYEMVVRAASYLIKMGPATEQDRWEEASGYSPSTLATNIAALVCAAKFMSNRRDSDSALYLLEYADFLESHIEKWTCTKRGTLVPGITNHFIRILPVDIDNPRPNEDPDSAVLILANQPPNSRYMFPANQIVDGGFLELVRYGIRAPDDPLIVDSLKVVDKILKTETPYGPCWHRYNFDGYGQKDDGQPYTDWGRGRLWPLLTGERGHYELALGKNGVKPFIEAMEKFASPTGLVPEQVWDSKDIPEEHMYIGRSTGAAMPLMWAHAEYIKLLRSANDAQVFDTIPEVVERYVGRSRKTRKSFEIWKKNRQSSGVEKGSTLRIQCPNSFMLHYSLDDWSSSKDLDSTPTRVGADFVDIEIPEDQKFTHVKFTFFWKSENKWEGSDYTVVISEKS